MPVINYLWDPETAAYLMEMDGNDQTTAVYTNEPVLYGSLISQRRGGETSCYHYDGLGNTCELTNVSEVVTDTKLYDAWGVNVASTGTTENPFKWRGRDGYYFGAATDDYYVRARTYEPNSGRWLSIDPLQFVDGTNLYRPFFVPTMSAPGGEFLYPFSLHDAHGDDLRADSVGASATSEPFLLPDGDMCSPFRPLDCCLLGLRLPLPCCAGPYSTPDCRCCEPTEDTCTRTAEKFITRDPVTKEFPRCPRGYHKSIPGRIVGPGKVKQFDFGWCVKCEGRCIGDCDPTKIVIEDSIAWAVTCGPEGYGLMLRGKEQFVREHPPKCGCRERASEML